MSAFEWFALGFVCFIGALGLALTLLSINGRSEAEDAEERRAVSKRGDEWSQEQMRREGLL